jgi:transposase
MARFVVGDDRNQSTLFPERLDDYLAEDNPVRAIDVFVDELDLAQLGFGGVEPETTGRPAYHPGTLLKFTSTDTSIGCSRAGVWNGSASATSSWFG